MIFKSLFSLLSPAGSAARLTILIFHRVHGQADPLFPDEVTAVQFETLCRRLRSWYRVLPLDEAARRLRERSLPARAACLSFDDGYLDNHDQALPILQRLGLPCSFFISTGFLEGGCMWNDKVIESIRACTRDELDLADVAPGLGVVSLRDWPAKRAAVTQLLNLLKYLPGNERQQAVERLHRLCNAKLPALMMRAEQVRAMRQAGMQIGAHTVNHPILAGLDDESALAEIVNSRRQLEGLLDAPVNLFAYPNGKPVQDYNSRTVQLVRQAGFETAVTTAWGVADAATDPLQLPRFTPWNRDRLKFGLRLVENARRMPQTL